MTPSTLPEELPALSHNFPNGLHVQPPIPLEGTITLEKKGLQALQGTYYDMFEGLWKVSGEEVPVLVKRPRRLHLDRSTVLGLEERFERRIRRETFIWNTLRHENIAQFIGYQNFYWSTNPQLIEEANLLSPIFKNGSLQSYLDANPNVSYTRRLELLQDAARGLAYLHSLEPPIAHGNIRPSGILVTDDVRCVLYDFAHSRIVTDFQTGFTTSPSTPGVAGFQPPELVTESAKVTPMSDVYGLGGTILSVMTGKEPFHRLRTQAARVIAIGTYNDTPNPKDHPKLPESDQLWRLMRKCWDLEPSRRPLTTQIIYKINLIMDCESGFTAPFGQTTITTSGEALPDSEESVVQPGVPLPSLPPPIPGSLTKDVYIGGGGYGEVHRGYWTPPGKGPIPVAIKSLKLSKAGPTQAQNNWVLTKRIRRETVIWKAAEHPNILKFYGHQLVDGSPLLVSSWCRNGDLWSYLAKNPGLMRKERLKLLCGAGKGLSHLHSLHPPICHGDIKPQNVVISDSMEALLCDFGISRIITSPGITEMTTLGEATGTPGFGAKEVLEGSGPTEKGDVYAFGGLILATMSGERPFHKKRNNNLIIIAISRDETPKPVDYPQIPMTDPLWVLMNKCWDPEPSQRPSMTQVVAELQAAG